MFWRSGTATHHGTLVFWPVTLHTSLALQPSGPTLKAPWPGTPAVRGGTPALLQSSTQALQPSTLALWPSTPALRVRHSPTPAGTPASSGGQAQVQEASAPKGRPMEKGRAQKCVHFLDAKRGHKRRRCIVHLRLLWPRFGSRKRTLKKGRFLVAPVAPGSGCKFFSTANKCYWSRLHGRVRAKGPQIEPFRGNLKGEYKS